MSKGGAGKVYFVLYLAVILELLIIFIERDEAEENLRKQQQEAIQIVQTILSQLQTGSGASGITVNPKDQIVLDPDNAKNVRNYEAKVSVGDPKAVFEYNGKKVKGDDIPKLEYIVSHIADETKPEEELGADTADLLGDPGTVFFKAELGMDVEGYTTPRQTFGGSIPAPGDVPYFTLNETRTQEEIAKGNRVKVFNISFQPNQGKGWYRLRLFSKTNKIVGITNPNPGDYDTVRIGTVKLTVKQLKNVRKALTKQKSGASEAVNLDDVLQLIDDLLTPGKTDRMGGNISYNSFNVLVKQPPAVKPSDPVASWEVGRDTVYWYAGAPLRLRVKLGPKEGARDVPLATLTTIDETNNRFEAEFTGLQEGMNIITAQARNSAGQTAVDERKVVVQRPELKTPRYRGSKAVVGNKYNPTSEWKSTDIPPSDYQTVVTMDGRQVFDQSGTNFKPAELPNELIVGDAVREIKTIVYWKPGGTADRSKWVPLLSTDPAVDAPIKPGAVTKEYPAPEQEGIGDFTFVLTPTRFNETFSPLVFKQKTGAGAADYSDIDEAELSCEECEAFGVSGRLSKVDGVNWSLIVDVDKKKVKPTINGHKFEFAVILKGRKKPSADGAGVAFVTFTIGKR